MRALLGIVAVAVSLAACGVGAGLIPQSSAPATSPPTRSFDLPATPPSIQCELRYSRQAY